MHRFVVELLAETRGADYALDFLNAARNEDLEAKHRFLVGRINAAMKQSGNPERNDTVRVRVLFCGRAPTFLVDKSVPIKESGMIGQKSGQTTDEQPDGARTSQSGAHKRK